MATAGITSDFKKLVGDLVKADLTSDSASYYVGLARFNDDLSLSNTLSETLSDERLVRQQLTAIKVASRATQVVPTVQWEANRSYNAYDDKNNSQTEFYVLNSNRQVFLCVQQPKSLDGTALNSTIEPTSALASSQAKTFETSDGYLWKYLYSITAADFSNFKTNNYMPIRKVIDDTIVLPEDIRSRELQDSSVGGQIIGIAIDSAGQADEYSSVPSIQITGNGAGASFSATINGGLITAVTLDSNGDGTFLHGSGYDVAKVTPSTGSASLRPIIGPIGGVNADPTRTLRSNLLMVQVQIDNTEPSAGVDTILAENDFRTVALFRNLKKYNSDSDFTGNTANGLTYYELTARSGTFLEDEIATTPVGSKQTRVFYHDTVSSPERLYVAQDETTGYLTIVNGDTLETPSGGQAKISSINYPEFDKFSGELLYINNVTSIVRDTNQSEDIRIVIELD